MEIVWWTTSGEGRLVDLVWSTWHRLVDVLDHQTGQLKRILAIINYDLKRASTMVVLNCLVIRQSSSGL